MATILSRRASRSSSTRARTPSYCSSSATLRWATLRRAHCARTARALHAHCTRTARALHAHCMRTACALQRAGDADRRAAAVDGRASDAHGAPLAQAPDRARDQGQKGQRQAGVVVGKGGYRNRHLWHHRHRRRPRRVTVAAPGHKGHPLLGMCDMCTCFVAPRFLCAGNCRQPEPHV